MLKVLFLGEIVGMPAISFIKKNLPLITEKYKIDFTIANGDGASDGYGILKNSAYQLNKAGINILTTGDFVFNKKDAHELLSFPFVLKPYNLPQAFGGNGYTVVKVKDFSIGIINILGRINFSKVFASCPFYSVGKAVEKIKEKTNIIIVDFHGGATSEIQAMQWHLAGKVSIVAGTNLRVLTSDARIIEDKTAIITGLGFCGGEKSVAGFEPEIEISKIKTGQFFYSKAASQDIRLQGIIVEIDEATGAAKKIELFNSNSSFEKPEK
jgi:2',3'-cyclic-nucleotide 2'-phosphodiesterase